MPKLRWQPSKRHPIRLTSGLVLKPLAASFEPFEVTARIAMTDAFPEKYAGAVRYECDLRGASWRVSPIEGEVAMTEGGLAEHPELTFTYQGAPGQEEGFFDPPLVRCVIDASDADVPVSQDVSLDLPRVGRMKTREAPRRTIEAFSGEVKLDGVLDDVCWHREPDVANFCLFTVDGLPKAKTHAWLNWVDDGLVVAYRCFEPRLSSLHDKPVGRDGRVYTKDSVEVLIDPGSTDIAYRQLVVGAAGALFDAHRFDDSWTSEAQWAVGREEDAWTAELRIPWRDLGMDSVDPGKVLRILLARNRFVGEHEVSQWPLAPGSNHQPELFGAFELLPDSD